MIAQAVLHREQDRPGSDDYRGGPDEREEKRTEDIEAAAHEQQQRGDTYHDASKIEPLTMAYDRVRSHNLHVAAVVQLSASIDSAGGQATPFVSRWKARTASSGVGK
jgi:hypothetical protein